MEDRNLLGDEHTSAGRIDALGINTADLLTGGKSAEGTLAGRQRHGVRRGDGTSQAALLGVDSRNLDHLILIDGQDGRSESANGLQGCLRRGRLKNVAARGIADLERGRAKRGKSQQISTQVPEQGRLTPCRGQKRLTQCPK